MPIRRMSPTSNNHRNSYNTGTGGSIVPGTF